MLFLPCLLPFGNPRSNGPRNGFPGDGRDEFVGLAVLEFVVELLPDLLDLGVLVGSVAPPDSPDFHQGHIALLGPCALDVFLGHPQFHLLALLKRLESKRPESSLYRRVLDWLSFCVEHWLLAPGRYPLCGEPVCAHTPGYDFWCRALKRLPVLPP